MGTNIKLPFLGSFDLSKPASRKNFIRITLAFAMLVVMLVVLIVSLFPKKAKEPDPASVVVTASAPGIGVPDIPEGADNDQLDNITVRDIRKGKDNNEGTAEQLFAQVSGASDVDIDPSNTPKPTDRSVGESVFAPRTDIYPEAPEKTHEEKTETPARKRTRPEYTSDDVRRNALIRAGINPDTGELTPEKMAEITGQKPQQPTQQASAASSTQETQQDVPSVPSDEEPAPVLVRRSGGVSSLGSRRGGNVGSLDEASQYVTSDPLHPFMVKFAYDQKVTNGERVTLRLCEDMTVDGVLIPVNTHLFATASIGDRMELVVNNININGKIYPLNYIAYDTDGGRGLYCPTSASSKAREQAGNDAEQIASSAISAVISGYAGRIVQSGSNIIRSIGGDTSVKISAGYMFFIMRADAENQMRH